jgi:hypothetical protein
MVEPNRAYARIDSEEPHVLYPLAEKAHVRMNDRIENAEPR